MGAREVGGTQLRMVGVRTPGFSSPPWPPIGCATQGTGLPGPPPRSPPHPVQLCHWELLSLVSLFPVGHLCRRRPRCVMCVGGSVSILRVEISILMGSTLKSFKSTLKWFNASRDF